MGDIITWIIIGLFALFFIYFAYTVIDTLILSKKVRRKAKGIGASIAEETKEISKDQEMKKEIETLAKGTSVVPSESSDKKIKKESRKFSFPKLFGGKKKTPKPNDDSSNYVATRIDNAYFEIIEGFVAKVKGSWTQQEFYELLLTLVQKGYDKKPSEINKDLQLAKQDMVFAEHEKEKNVPHADTPEIDVDSDDGVENSDSRTTTEKIDSTMKESKNEAVEETFERVHEKKVKSDIKDGEKELKKISDEKKSDRDTRKELDKTLSEIKALRERLKDI